MPPTVPGLQLSCCSALARPACIRCNSSPRCADALHVRVIELLRETHRPSESLLAIVLAFHEARLHM